MLDPLFYKKNSTNGSPKNRYREDISKTFVRVVVDHAVMRRTSMVNFVGLSHKLKAKKVLGYVYLSNNIF